MATKLSLRHPSGLYETAYVGWSWTGFLFGGIPCIFRGDWLGFFIWLVITVVLATLTLGFGNVILLILWAAFYNKWHARRLIERGYQITDGDISPEIAKARING